VFQLDIPFAHHPLRGIHDYLFKGQGRNLLVDTALNDDLCEAALREELRKLDARLEETDIFLTHTHVDHCGLIARLKCEGSCEGNSTGNKVFASEVDRFYIDRFQSSFHGEWLTQLSVWCGAPEEHMLKPQEHVSYFGRPSYTVPIEEVRPGDILRYGEYELEIVDLAGHTPGQVGLWHAATGSLFSGDHILNRITPSVTVWNLEHDYLKIFCDNLNRVRGMLVHTLYPAHGKPLESLEDRIDELLCHHAVRLDQMEALVKAAKKPVPSFHVTKNTEWSRGKKFTDLPIQEKWFACSETLAHLRHLVNEGRLFSHWFEDTLFFAAQKEAFVL